MITAVSHPVGSLAGVRMLLVDDDDDIRECLADILRVHAANVITARSGVEGLDKFDRERPDLLLSDLCMPDLDGHQMIRRIRARPPAAGGLTPAIALSASANVTTTMMAGYHALITKPFDIAKLVALVEDFTRPEGPVRLVSPWAIEAPTPTSLLVTAFGDLRAGDMANLMRALVRHLGDRPVDVTADLRRLVSFSPSVGSIGERLLWSRRKSLRSLRVIGGSFLARLISAAACRALDIRWIEDDGGVA
jgi:CheY-like chemotaxis protein